MKILIIANSRFSGGLSGGDAIYESFIKYWPGEIFTSEMQNIDYKPFFICYLHRIFLGCIRALFDNRHFDFVYSASDFLMDSIPAAIYKAKGKKWVAGFFLRAFPENRIHFHTQKVVRKLIEFFADMVVVTNETMYKIFPNKKKTWINGGIELELSGASKESKYYDAVFCGRIHPSKGIDELIEIWDLVRKEKPNARMAIIGDGDLGLEYIRHKLFSRYGTRRYNGIDLLGYMGDERFEIYKKSKLVLYPTPLKYDHFSMAPVEAMACGCPCVSFDTPVISAINPSGWAWASNIENFALIIAAYLANPSLIEDSGKMAMEWAKKFDYKKQSTRVFEEIRKELKIEDSNHGGEGDGRDGFNPMPRFA